MRLRRRQIVLFAGIGGEVEEFLLVGHLAAAAARSEGNPFPVPDARGLVGVREIPEHLAPRRRCLALQHGQQVEAVVGHARREFRPGGGGERGKNLQRGDELVRGLARGNRTRPPREQRHAEATLEAGALAAAQADVVDARAVAAVVGVEQHERVAIEAELAERGEQLADRLVHRGDHAGVFRGGQRGIERGIVFF